MVATITQQYYETETGLDALVTGMYDHLRLMWMRNESGGTGTATRWWSDRHDIGNSDQFLPTTYSPTGSSPGLGTPFLFYQNNPYYQRWGPYACYNDALNIIHIIDNSAANIGGAYADEAYCNQQKAIAMFAKDYMLYYISTFIGDVFIPQERTMADSGVYYGPRSTSKELYEMFIEDMAFAYKWLPEASEYSGSESRERITKGAAAMMLAHFYLDIALGEKYASLREADGSFSKDGLKALGMLYKGTPTSYVKVDGTTAGGSAADGAIYWATQLIEDSNYALEDNYAIFGENISGDYSDEESKEIVWAMAASPLFDGEKNNNGAWGWRTEDYYVRYVNNMWGTGSRAWQYGSNKGYSSIVEWGMDVFTDKIHDARYAHTFFLEYRALLPVSQGVDKPNVSYLQSTNSGATWLTNQNPISGSEGQNFSYVDYFNNLDKEAFFGAGSPYVNRVTAVTSGADYTTSSDKKINGGDISIVMIANDREHAMDADLAHSMPFVVSPLWCYYEGDGDVEAEDLATRKYYTGRNSSKAMHGNPEFGLGSSMNGNNGWPAVKKYIDPNRVKINSETAGRNVNVFRLADAYLIRAWAKGIKEDYADAIEDINVIRRRASYKDGEARPMAIAQFSEYYAHSENLTAAEKKYPYTVAGNTEDAMEIDMDYFTEGTPEWEEERYPHFLADGESITNRLGFQVDRYNMNAGYEDATAFYFANFMLNEYSREFMGETVYGFIGQMSGLRYSRMMWHNQRASTIDVDEDGNAIWQAAAANAKEEVNHNGKAQGRIEPHMIWDPITIGFMNKLTDENGNPLDDAARAAYQNPGYN